MKDRKTGRPRAAVKDFQKLLEQRYGLLLRKGDIADLFGVSQESLHNTLSTSAEPHVELLQSGKVRFGRRIRFRVDVVARAISLRSIDSSVEETNQFKEVSSP